MRLPDVIRAMVRPSFATAITSLLAITIGACGGPGHGVDRAKTPGSDPVASSASVLRAGSDPCARGVADVGTFRGDAARTGRMPGPSLTGVPAIAWTVAGDGPLTSSPALIDGVVFQGSASGTLSALDMESGTRRWLVDLGAAMSSPTEIDDRLVVGLTSGDVVAVNPADGSVAWKQTLGGEILGAAAVDDGLLVVASTSGVVTAIESPAGIRRWEARLNGRIGRSPAIGGGVVVVPVEPGGLVALNLDTGTTLWRTAIAADGGVGTPSIADGFVLTAAGLDDAAPTSRAIVALDLKSGAVVWRWSTTDKDRVYSPAVASGRAFVVDEGAGVTALDVQTGRQLWRVTRDAPLEAVAATAGDSVLVVSNSGAATSLNVTNGATNWEVPIRGVPYGPVVSCGWVLVPTNLGTLTALRISS
jgi:outer membrane protein assembly factor BamB